MTIRQKAIVALIAISLAAQSAAKRLAAGTTDRKALK